MSTPPQLRPPAPAPVPVPAAPTGYPTPTQLCDNILATLRDMNATAPDIVAFMEEIQTLRKFLDLIERVRRANAPRTGFEEEHFCDVGVLLERGRGCLMRVEEVLEDVGAREENVESGGWKRRDGEGLVEMLGVERAREMELLRGMIAFFVQAFQMSLLAVKLVYQWKSQLLQDGIYFHQKDLSDAIHRLKEDLARRKGLGEDGMLHSPVQEELFLYDVEKCVFSAEIIMGVTTSTIFENGLSPGGMVWSRSPRSPAEEGSSTAAVSERLGSDEGTQEGSPLAIEQLPLLERKLSPLAPLKVARPATETHTAVAYRPPQPAHLADPPTTFHSNNNAKHRGSIDSDNESIFDPEPEFKDCFPAAVYSELIYALQKEVRKDMERGEFSKAEQSHRRAMEYLTDRERKLGIPFDNKADMQEILAIINIRQGQLQEAKKILNNLLKEEIGETVRKWRLYHAVAEIYHTQSRLPEAEKFAKRAYIGREKTLARDDPLLLESVNLLVTIYEQEGKMDTADALRRVYRAESVLPEVPPKSKDREKVFQPHPDVVQEVDPPRVRWAPDVWVDPSSINAPTKSGETPLISAISTGDDELVNLMLQRGADVEARCVDPMTPLMHAINHQYPTIAELLLNKGAALEATTAGWTALHRAADLSNIPLTTLLLSYGADIEARAPKEFAPKQHPLSRIRTSDLANYDAVSTSSATIGWTPLLLAASAGREPIVRLLLSHGAQIEARSPSNGTPLLCACEGNHESTVDHLLMNGADIHAEDEFGWKPLHRALVSPSPSTRIAQLLLTHGAYINARDAYRKTPLHHAIEKGNETMVTFLLTAGADFEARDVAERTPLQTAIECRFEGIVRALLDAGADAEARDAGGRDALAAATHALRRSPEIIALLGKHKKAQRLSVSCASRVSSVSTSSGGRSLKSGSWWLKGRKRG